MKHFNKNVQIVNEFSQFQNSTNNRKHSKLKYELLISINYNSARSAPNE